MEKSSRKRGFFERGLLLFEVVLGLSVVVLVMGRAYGTVPAIVFVLAGAALAFTFFVSFKMVASLSDPSLDVVGRIPNKEREALDEQKRLLLEGIKELEVDAGIGKVDAQDYAYLRRSTEEAALKIIRKLKDEENRYKADAEALVGAPLVGAESHPNPKPNGDHAVHRASTSQAKGSAPCADPSVFYLASVDLTPLDDGLRCDHCQQKNPLDAQFCIGCGGQKRSDAQGTADSAASSSGASP